MSFSRPRSFLQLVLLGFVLVMLPLIIATINATLSVDRLATQSQQAVQNAAQVTKSSEEIAEHLIHMERIARQYHVLGDADLFVAYRTAHEQFALMTSDLARLPLNDYQQRQLQILIEKESSVFQSLRGSAREDVEAAKKTTPAKKKATKTPVSAKAKSKPNPAPADANAEKALAEFQTLVPFAEMIRLASEQVVNRQAASMQKAAQKSKQMLVWQALAVIPGTVVFAIIFVTLISRPIRQIRQATLQLGEGDFSSQITISGPRDLENLGQSLDWLRVRLIWRMPSASFSAKCHMNSKPLWRPFAKACRSWQTALWGKLIHPKKKSSGFCRRRVTIFKNCSKTWSTSAWLTPVKPPSPDSRCPCTTSLKMSRWITNPACWPRRLSSIWTQRRWWSWETMKSCGLSWTTYFQMR